MGGATPFATSDELGTGLRQISDLSATIETAKEAIQSKRAQQEQIASRAREQERSYMISDPSHRVELARLAREQAAQQQYQQQSQRQLQNLQLRTALTTDPAAAQAMTMSRAATFAGAGAAVASLAPSLIRNSAPVQIGSNLAQAGANLAGNATTPVTGQIIGQAMGSAGRIGGTLNPANMAMSGLRGPLGPLQELTKAGVEISKLPGQLMDWSEALLNSQRTLSRWDGLLAHTFAEQDRRGIMRGMDSAVRTGGTTSELSSSFDDLLDVVQPMRDSLTNVVASTLTLGVQKLTRLVQIGEGLYEATKDIPVFGAAIKVIEDRVKRLEDRDKVGGGNLAQKLLDDLKLHDVRKPRGVAKR
jgi:hypothetical protein